MTTDDCCCLWFIKVATRGSSPTHSKRKRQSPIPLTRNATIEVQFPNLIFNSSYYQKHKATFTNTGYNIEINFLYSSPKPTISGGGLRTEYVLNNLHFHWNSEHTVNGHRFPLEGHFVHYAKKYGSLKNAVKFQDGLAVFSILYNLTSKPNPVFHDLVKSIPAIAVNRNRPVTLEKRVAVYDFLPTNTQKFYRYRGSLTIPNYDEVVIWTIFSVQSYLSKSQFLKLTQIYSASNTLITANNRELQKLNQRSVFYKTE
ncbi:carbonic anhydrase 4-like [Tenebrio molitor]|uniref:carbonic anhydrase 4-like n=1 Tax=Tenebrio molitor TaxID=7067 RepID=UPI00362473AD